MIVLRAFVFLLLSLLPAQAFWQSRDSNNNNTSLAGPPAPFIQVLAATGAAINSGSPTVLTSSADVPVGSTVVMAVNTATANQDILTCADNATVGGTPNSYVVNRPAPAAGVSSAALCYAINTTRDIPVGSVWTVTTAAAQYNVRGVWYVTGYNGGLDQSDSVNQATPGTSVASVATTTLANVADLAIGYAYVNAGLGTITESPLFTNLFNNTFNSIGYDAVTSVAPLTYAPTWSGASAYSAVLLTFLPTGAGGGCPTSATFIARTSGLSGTQISAYQNLICGLVTDGVWAKLDGFYVYATNTTTTANLNLISTSFSPSTTNGTCTFTANAGYTGNGTNCYQDTGWAPNAGGTQYQLNSATIGACSLTARTPVISTSYISTITDVVAFNDWTDITANNTGSWTFGVNAGFISASPGGTTQGSWIAVRSTAALTTLYHNGTSLASGTDASGVLGSQHGIVMARNRNAVIGNFNPDQFAYALFGGGLTGGDVANLHNRMHTFLSAVGAPAGC